MDRGRRKMIEELRDIYVFINRVDRQFDEQWISARSRSESSDRESYHDLSHWLLCLRRCSSRDVSTGTVLAGRLGGSSFICGGWRVRE
jgi:hypothetical protein